MDASLSQCMTGISSIPLTVQLYTSVCESSLLVENSLASHAESGVFAD